MPKPTFHNLPAAKRQRIIDAAIEVFSQSPYALATLDDLAAAAGVSKGSLYQYFAGKADLYAWLLTGYMAELKLSYIGAGAPGPEASIWEVFEQAWLDGVRFSLEHPGLTRLGVRFMRDYEQEPALAELARQQDEAGAAWIRATLERGRAQGEVGKHVDLELATAFFHRAMGPGMLELMAHKVGASLGELLARPEALEALGDDDHRALVRGVLRLLRDGVSP